MTENSELHFSNFEKTLRRSSFNVIASEARQSRHTGLAP